jgi:hypothetical protein
MPLAAQPAGANALSMPNPIDDPQHWRKRAKEVRTLAGSVGDPETRATLLQIAEDYERLAKQAERRAAPKRPPRKP